MYLSDGAKVLLSLTAILCIIFFGVAGLEIGRVDHTISRIKIERVVGTYTEVTRSNDTFLFGDPYRVQYEVKDSTDQVHVFTCESGTFTPQICRNY